MTNKPLTREQKGRTRVMTSDLSKAAVANTAIAVKSQVDADNSGHNSAKPGLSRALQCIDLAKAFRTLRWDEAL